MELLKQCQIWNENDEYQKIVDALEAVSPEERTPEMDSELARAFNNLANGDDRELFQKAIDLLKPHEEYFQGDHCWNFRIAYAYYYLDQEGPALHYFEKALEALPGDEDTQEFIDDCRRRLSLPRFEHNFREKTEQAWAAFEKIDAEVRGIIDADQNQQQGEEILAKCGEVLEIALCNPAFELGYNGEKYELILSPEGNRAKLFELVYFQRHAPAAVLEHWNIWVGRQPSHGFHLRSDDWEISGQDVQVWPDLQEGGRVSLALYCEKLLPLMQDNENKAWWILSVLTDQILGEVASIALIEGFDVLDTPKAAPSIRLSELPEVVKEMGLSLENDAAAYLENSYLAYELNPVQDSDADWRLDVYTGSTRLPVLINEYMSNQSEVMNDFHMNGIVAGFLCYPLDGFSGEEMAKNVLDFRDALQAFISENAGEEAVAFLGGATGLYSGYLDFIAWDLRAVLNAASVFFENSELPWANFHVFRRDVGGVQLISREEHPDGTSSIHEETGSLLSQEDIETLKSFDEGVSGYFGKMLRYINDFINDGVKEGKFTEKMAHQDLQIALWYSFACNNLDEYEYYYRATQWMPDSEQNAKGCGTWYYRYSVALMYCGRLEEARQYAEQGALEEPDYPWIWLQVGKLRAHFGDQAGALKAVDCGLSLEPDDYEFLTLQKEIKQGATLEQMGYHWIHPDADQSLQAGLDEDADEKQRAISCIQVNPEGLDRVKALFQPKDWTADAPYCSFHYPIQGHKVELVFKMNEAGLSKLRTEWLETLKGWLDLGQWLTYEADDGQTATLDAVLVGLDYRIGLIYKRPDENQYFQIFLRSDGSRIEDALWSSNNVQEEHTAEDKDSDSKGTFAGFVLLSDVGWDKAQLVHDLKEKWNISVEEDAKTSEDALVFEVGDMIAALSLMPAPIPNGEAELNAENNYMWPQAVEVAKAHKAHIMVAVLGKEENLLERGKLYAKLVAACCRQKNATGVYTSGVVFEPRFYEGFADMMREGKLPIFNWIWFGLYRREGGMCGYTYGMDVFGKDEMEVLDTDAEPEELQNFLASLVSYVLEYDVTLRDGETIGFSADDKHAIIRSAGVALPDQMTLKISYEPSNNRPDGSGDVRPEAVSAKEDEKKNMEPEIYTSEEMDAIGQHIERYFGKYDYVFHERISPDIHVDICMVPPSEDRDYYTLVTMGMGAHRMNVPEELSDYELERAELAIALPNDWKLTKEALQNEQWYWPIRLLKTIARFPGECDTWLGWGHTLDNGGPFTEHTKLSAAMLIGPQCVEDGGEVCALPNGEEVNFYQVIPLYQNEMEYKIQRSADDLLDKMEGISFVVHPNRPDAMTAESLDSGLEMDDGDWHLESIREKGLEVDERSAYNHISIYLRWCIEHNLMSEAFLEKYGNLATQVQSAPAGVELREFIRDELGGQLFTALFNKQGQAFAHYYYGDGDAPYYPSDIDDYALNYFGPARYHSDEFQDEAYLFIPFNEDYYQEMAKLIDKRFQNWQGQEFSQDTAPSELAVAMMDYLDCDCQYFPSMRDDDPITSSLCYAQRLGVREGFIPMLIKVDEILWECLILNSDPDNDGADDFAFDLDQVATYRKKVLSAPVKNGQEVLSELIGDRQAEAEDDDLDWDKILGAMEGGYANDRFAAYWDPDTDMTYPLILAKIPVKNPWEVFAYLPFGNWNECPGTEDLIAVAKYWAQQYGAVPAVVTHDELEFALPSPVSREKALELATEQYGFCPDVVDQGPEGATVGWLADVLRQSDKWYFWWD